MYRMYLHVYACICMYEPKCACCQQQQMNSSEIPRREKHWQQTRTVTAKDVLELNNIHNWIWSPYFTVVPIPVPRQLASESLRLCPILTEYSLADNRRLTWRAQGQDTSGISSSRSSAE